MGQVLLSFQAHYEVIWCQDFPKGTEKIPSDFKERLDKFLSSLGGKGGRNILDGYDFTKAKVDLISSIPGVHKERARFTYGHLRLSEILSEIGWPKEEIEVKEEKEPEKVIV